METGKSCCRGLPGDGDPFLLGMVAPTRPLPDRRADRLSNDRHGIYRAYRFIAVPRKRGCVVGRCPYPTSLGRTYLQPVVDHRLRTYRPGLTSLGRSGSASSLFFYRRQFSCFYCWRSDALRFYRWKHAAALDGTQASRPACKY